jgi:hypothetical protein
VAALVAPIQVMKVEHRQGLSRELVRVQYEPWIDGRLAARLDTILERYDANLDHFLWSVSRNFGETWHWAWIVYPRCYPLAEHLRSIRPDATSMPFTLHGREPEPRPPGSTPCVGTVFATTKDVLRTAAEQSPMFASAWEALCAQPEHRSWACLSDPLDPAWVASVGVTKDERAAGS